MKPTVIRIVDDDSDVCDSLSCLLSLEGWEIRIYTDPKEFLAGDLLTDHLFYYIRINILKFLLM